MPRRRLCEGGLFVVKSSSFAFIGVIRGLKSFALTSLSVYSVVGFSSFTTRFAEGHGDTEVWPFGFPSGLGISDFVLFPPISVPSSDGVSASASVSLSATIHLLGRIRIVSGPKTVRARSAKRFSIASVASRMAANDSDFQAAGVRTGKPSNVSVAAASSATPSKAGPSGMSRTAASNRFRKRPAPSARMGRPDSRGN